MPNYPVEDPIIDLSDEDMDEPRWQGDDCLKFDKVQALSEC